MAIQLVPILAKFAIGAALNFAASVIAPRNVGGRGGFSTSPTYGFDDLSNASYEGAPRFFVLGQHRVAPTVISAHTEQDGSRQIAKLLFFAGTGGLYGIEDISDVEINNQPISSWEGIDAAVRLGTSDQTAIKGYEKVGTPHTVDHTLQASTAFTHDKAFEYETKEPVDEVRLVFVWDRFMRQRSSGDIDNTTWTADIAVWDEDEEEWVKVPPPTQKEREPLFSFLKFGHKPSDWLNANDAWRVTTRSTSSIRRTAVLSFDTTAKRKIRVTAWSQSGQSGPKTFNQARILRVEEIVDDARAYAGSSLLALSIPAQENLSGGIPKVTCLVKGWKIEDPRDGSKEWTRNPALCVRQFMLDEDDGAGDWFDASEFADGSGESWRDAADDCDANRTNAGKHAEPTFEMDLVVDSIQSAGDWIEHMLTTFRATMFEAQGKIEIRIDGLRTRDRWFDAMVPPAAGHRPIVRGDDARPDFQEHQIPVDRRPNIVEVFFTDRDTNFERRTTGPIKDTAALDAGEEPVREEITLYGVTRLTQAMRHGRYVLNRARLAPRLFEHAIGAGDFDLVPLDRFGVLASNPSWESQASEDARDYLVQSVVYDLETMSGRVFSILYDPSVYSDFQDTLPPKAKSLTRQEALKRLGTLNRGVSNVTVEEVKA